MGKTFQDMTTRTMPTHDQLSEMERDLEFRPVTADDLTALTPAQIEQFNRDGCLMPLRVLEKAESESFREHVDGLLAEAATAGADSYSLISAHIRFGRVYDLVFHPRILDYVCDLLGPDVVCWGAHYFCKMPRDGKRVAWHQDASYWPLSPSKTVTAWLAVDGADTGNGCMRFIPGSHLHGQIEFRRSEEDEANVLNQTVDAAERYGSAPVNVVLQPGEISLHSDLMLHGSEANDSDRRRCGLTLRYAAVEVRAQMNWNSEGVLVSGTDPEGHWANPPRPGRD